MSMNQEQLDTLATDIRANPDPAVQQSLIDENYEGIAHLYNEPTIYFSWLSSLSVEAYKGAIIWEEMRTAITSTEATIWEWLTSDMTAPLDVSNADIRDGMRAVWVNAPDTGDRLLSVSMRNVTEAEMLFVEGTTGSPVTPYTFGWEGVVTESDVAFALNDSTYVSNEVALMNEIGKEHKLTVTLTEDLPVPVSIQYQVRNNQAHWKGSSIQGLTNVQLAGVYYARLPGEMILTDIASVRVVNPLNVAVSLEVERL